MLLASFASAQTLPSPAPTLAQQRLVHLRRGVNLSNWFAQVYDPKGYSPDHFQHWVTADDLALIKSLGFDHVRLSVNPQPMFHDHQAENLSGDFLASLDAAVQMILDHGLSVILDLHPDDDFKARLSNDDFAEQFADFWRALAAHYSKLDAGRIYFEILNEPEVADRYRWLGMQSKLAAAIRQGAPQHTILASGARYSSEDELLFVEPLADPNVIYNFHFYDPTIFTHQGANWGVNFWHQERGVTYPSQAESTEAAAAKVPEEMNRLYAARYGFEHWDAARIDLEIRHVAEWAKRRNLAVTCNEFGVYAKYADLASRAAWIHDVRTSLEKYGIGWTIWDYSGSFGIVSKPTGNQNGKIVPDPQIIRALGMTVP